MTVKRSRLISTMAAAGLTATLLAPFAQAAELDASAGASATVNAPASRGVLRPRAENIGSSGQDGVSVGGKMTAPTAAQFCDMIDSRMRIMSERMGAMKTRLDTERSSRDLRINNRQENRADALKKARDTQNARLDGIVAMLNAKATTSVQKAAIVTFQAEMKAALTVRRSAIDQANADFKTGLQKLRVDHMTKVDAAVTALEAAINTALNQAKSDCTAGNTGATVRAAMLKSIEAARAKFKADTASIDKIGPSAKRLADAHRIALDKAFAAFKTSAEASRKALKAAFPNEAEDGMKKSSGTIDANVNGSVEIGN